MTDNLLQSNDSTDQVGDDQIDQTKSFYEQLVGEGRKFKDPEALAKSKLDSDSYVQILLRRLDEKEDDNKKLREEYNAAASLRELVDQLKTQRREPALETPQMRDDVTTTPPAIDKIQIESLVNDRIRANEVEQIQKRNWDTVKSKLEEVYGPNFAQTLNKQVKELGLTDDDVNALARKSPAAFFRTLGLEEKKQDSFQAPPRSDRRNDNFAPQGAKKRTWSYYQNLKKSDPRAYNDPKTTVQMHKDFDQLGDEFKDGDWYSVR